MSKVNEMSEKMENLPEGWKRVKLGEVIIENPKSPLNVEDADGEGNYPFFTSGESVLNHSKYVVDGDNLFMADGGVSNIVYFRGKASYSNHVYSFKVKEKINSFFVFKYLQARLEQITNLFFTGTGLKNLSKPIFKSNFLVVFPENPVEQKKIAEILETLDNAIEKADAIIEKYKRMKHGSMQDLLTKGIDENWQIRSEKTHKFKDSLLGKIPAEWEVVRLGEVGKIIYGERLSENEYDEYGDSFAYGTGGILGKTKKYLDIGESIVIPRKGSISNIFYVKSNKKFYVIDTAFYLKSDRSLDMFFLFTYLQRFDLSQLNEATGVPSLNRKNLYYILIPLPPLPEQKRIAEILSQIDEVIEKEQTYKEKLERLKRGLMEDLLTGKVRVNNLIKEGAKQ